MKPEILSLTVDEDAMHVCVRLEDGSEETVRISDEEITPVASDGSVDWSIPPPTIDVVDRARQQRAAR